MSNYFEYHDTVAFHPGYYIKEIIEERAMTQEEFARRLGTTPKTLSLLLRGEQSLSVDIAMKLSRLLGTSIAYWLNLQNSYDALTAEYRSDLELEEEKQILDILDYEEFTNLYSLPDPQKAKADQILRVRRYLDLSSLTSLKKKDLTAPFRSFGESVSERKTIRANATVQIAVNRAMETIDPAESGIPHYSRTRFRRYAQNALSLTRDQDSVCSSLRQTFLESGVILVILPVLPGTEVSGAVRKIGDQVLLLISEDSLTSDLFWYRLYREIGNILSGEYGITFEGLTENKRAPACSFAEDTLISPSLYRNFVKTGHFDTASVKAFSDQISRTPGIVLGRLKRDGYLDTFDQSMEPLICRYTV